MRAACVRPDPCMRVCARSYISVGPSSRTRSSTSCNIQTHVCPHAHTCGMHMTRTAHVMHMHMHMHMHMCMSHADADADADATCTSCLSVCLSVRAYKVTVPLLPPVGPCRCVYCGARTATVPYGEQRGAEPMEPEGPKGSINAKPMYRREQQGDTP